MSMLAIAASTVALGYALYRLHLGFWRKRLFSALPYAEEHRIPTEDGAHFELRRLPCETPDPEKPPVLLVHGLGANHRNHDAWEGASLARYLAARGSDVWLLTLRSGLPRGIPSRLVRFAAMVQHDVPQAVAEVRRRTGADAIDYVGFSMGGMLLYAAIGASLPSTDVRKVGIIGSPARVVLPQLVKWVDRLPDFLIPGARYTSTARFWAFAVGWIPTTPLHYLVFNPSNVERHAAGRALMTLVEDVPRGLQLDFLAFARNGGDVRTSGVSVMDSLANIRNPVLFLAGAGDVLGAPATLVPAFDAWGSPDKQMHVLGRNTGTEHDYGHGDLAIGRHVERDVFARIEEFLRR